MKKQLALLLAALLLLSLAACGGKPKDSEEGAKVDDTSTLFTVTKEDGTTETLTADELNEIYATNEINFEENYSGASVEAEGTISKVETDSEMVYMLGTVDFVDVVRFTLNDSVQFQLTPSSLEEFGLDASQITSGMKVHLTGSLGYGNLSVVVNYPTSVTLVEE